MPLELSGIERDSRFQMKADDIVGSILSQWKLDARNVRRSVQNSLSKEEPRRELIIVAGGSHGHGDRANGSDAPSLEPELNLQRLLDGHVIVIFRREIACYPTDLDVGGMGVIWHLRFSTL